MIELPYVVADVFCSAALEGNPVAVFTDARQLDGATMQRLARELNLSETVFVTGPASRDTGAVPIRIFTPAVELPFAGHPVLGTACVLAARDGDDIVRLATGSGVVPVTLTRDGDRVLGGEMDQPLPTWEEISDPAPLFAALGVSGSTLPVEVYDNGPRHTYVMLATDAEVTALAPDMAALASLDAAGEFGDLGVSCLHAEGSRVHTRMFGPALGVAEDPATGSAAGPLAVHLARHGVVAFGARLVISQGAEIGRPSTLRACAEGRGETVTRVAVGGDAVIVADGRFRI